MTPPVRPSGGIISQTAMNLQAFHPSIPEERLQAKVGSTFLGCVFGGIGLVAFGIGIRLVTELLARRAVPPTSGELIACAVVGGVGVSFMILGAAIADMEVVKQPIKLVVATIQGVAGALRGRGDGS